MTWIAAALLVAALGWRTRRWRWTLLVVASACAGVMWVANEVWGGTWIFQPRPPWSVDAWVAAGVFAVLAVAVGFRAASARQRLLALPAVALCLLVVGGQGNWYYGYYPTVDSLFSRHFVHEVSLHELRTNGYLGHHSVRVRGASSGPTTSIAGPDPLRPARSVGVANATAAAELKRVTGRVVGVDIPGTVSGFHARRAWVYLPPLWFAAARPRLPVVVLLSGTPGSPTEWLRNIGVQHIADAYAATHGGWTPILVAVDENGSFMADTECVNRPRAQADTYLAVDVRDFVARTFDTATAPTSWAVEGLSEGGTCAITVALRHPNVFGSFVDIAGEATPTLKSPASDLRTLYGGSTAKARTYDPAYLLRSGRGAGLGAWFEVGASDGKYLRANRQLFEIAANTGAHARLRIRPGAHTYGVFRSGFIDSFPWLCHRLGSPGHHV
jgi:S-formylglutathione hydrolase FrmB